MVREQVFSVGEAARYREVAFYWALGTLGVQVSVTLFILVYYDTFEALVFGLLPAVGLIIDSLRKAFRPTRTAPFHKFMNLSFPQIAFVAGGIGALAATFLVLTNSRAVHSGGIIFLVLWMWTLWAGVVQGWYALRALALQIDSCRTLEIVLPLPAATTKVKSEATIWIEVSKSLDDVLARVGTRLDARDVTLTGQCVRVRTRAAADEEEVRHVGPLLRLSGVRIIGVRGNPAPLLVRGAILHAVA